MYMNINYPEVPNMITGKDLDYLSDMYEWNSGCYKSVKNSMNQVTDAEIKGALERASQMFSSHVSTILNILGGNQA